MDNKIEIALDSHYELPKAFGFAGWVISNEKRACKGEVRVIGGRLMYAYSAYSFKTKFIFTHYRVSWIPVETGMNTPEHFKAWFKGLMNNG